MSKLLARWTGWGRAHEAGGDGDVSATPRRKSVVPLWRRTGTVAMAALLGAGTAGGATWWAMHTGWLAERMGEARWAVIKLAADQGLTVEEILVTGRAETNGEALLGALGVARGAPILAFDFEGAKARVESLPWVLTARIERLLPNTLVVHLIERKPIALWQHQGQFALIDEEGVTITRDGLGRFANLIQVVGEDAPNHVGGLLELLETQPVLKAQVRAAVRVGGRRWDLTLRDGVDVRLPADGAPEALARLADFEQETGALSRDVRVLDLRVPDRVIVRRQPALAPQAPQVTEKKTGQET